MADIREITDFSDPALDVYARLTEAQLMNRFDPSKAMFIAESPKVINRALDGGYAPISMLMERMVPMSPLKMPVPTAEPSHFFHMIS